MPLPFRRYHGRYMAANMDLFLPKRKNLKFASIYTGSTGHEKMDTLMLYPNFNTIELPISMTYGSLSYHYWKCSKFDQENML